MTCPAWPSLAAGDQGTTASPTCGPVAVVMVGRVISLNECVRVFAEEALEIFVPFGTAYLCEQSFSRVLDVKNEGKERPLLRN